MLISTDVAIKHLHWLVANGCAVREGRYRQRKWFATSQRPESGKGLAPASLAALAGGQVQWEERLAKAIARKQELIASGRYQVKRGPQLAFKARNGHGAIMLEQLWPLPGTFAHVKVNADNRDKPRRGALPVVMPEDKEAA